jgi:hypothetical protein
MKNKFLEEMSNDQFLKLSLYRGLSCEQKMSLLLLLLAMMMTGRLYLSLS